MTEANVVEKFQYLKRKVEAANAELVANGDEFVLKSTAPDRIGEIILTTASLRMMEPFVLGYLKGMSHFGQSKEDGQ